MSLNTAVVDELFQQRFEEKLTPGLAYGVVRGSELIHSGAFGATTEGGPAPTAESVFRIASMSKSFTAAAVLLLRDRGLVDLDEAIAQYVPELVDQAPYSADSPAVTLRLLLSMSAGLPTDDPWGDRQESISDDDLDALLRRGLTFDSIPGTRFAYSNLGYALLGRVISVATGRPYRDVVTDDILRPLGLSSTGFVKPEGADDRLAIGHRRVGDEWEALPFSGPGGFSSIGGLFSTVPDLARWARWLGSAFDPDQDAIGDFDGILSRASRREMQQAYRAVPSAPVPTGYGYGLFIEEQPGLGTIVSHSGGYPGFSAHMRWQPASGWGIVAFENATYAQVAVPATTAIHGLLHELDLTPGPRVLPETAAARVALQKAVVDGDELPADLVSENVELDIPLARRRHAWAQAIETIGGLELPVPIAPVPDPTATSITVDAESGDESTSPTHLVWRLPGVRGQLRLEIRLSPEAPPRVQTILVRADRLS